jgi:hypothetical protein
MDIPATLYLIATKQIPAIATGAILWLDEWDGSHLA